ncbi:Hypothetical Protein FCC1311_075862 [Hondaea fermentalgiana]|uniref:Transmembrane protein n=1 Tax=Hondaea fermentalgiana TaxID=2315210 RepID=A0A2R5GKC4_9STRA|nr:Hypothetical Protein FCC1311_075862 [Hondaea fermentalgiana]|eukprot:GBG31362.1 Hypothetical Protein FCC1311_075862 [Hondaea fermentalgiana]
MSGQENDGVVKDAENVPLTMAEDVDKEEHPSKLAASAAKMMHTLENLNSKESETVIGPGTAALFALSCAGMLSVGFQLGMRRELKKDKPEIVPGSLRERVGQPSQLPEVKRAREIQSRRRPAPALLAFRALGYATVLTTSTATAVCIFGKWYYNIRDTEDLIWRLKRNVPEKGATLKSWIGPPLEGLRDGLMYLFSPLKPMLAPKGNDATLSRTIDQERSELERLGVDTSILEPIPEPPKNIGGRSSSPPPSSPSS